MLAAFVAIYMAIGIAIDSFFYDSNMSDGQAVKRLLLMTALWPLLSIMFLVMLFMSNKMRKME